MSKNNWREYLADDFEDTYEKTERIPHRPKREELEKGKELNKIKPQNNKTDRN